MAFIPSKPVTLDDEKSKKLFHLDNIDKVFPVGIVHLVGRLTLGWARFDTVLSFWMAESFGMEAYPASIMMGNMDTKSKLERLSTYFKYRESAEELALVNKIRKEHSAFVDTRNAVAHWTCAGVSKLDRNLLIFAPFRKHQSGQGLLMRAIGVGQIHECGEWAQKAADQILELRDSPAETQSG